MHIKLTALGMLIYPAMAAWLAASVGYLASRRRLGDALLGAGSALMAVAFALRWVEVRHAPLQNLFEVFVCLGMLIYPLWMFCERRLGARGPAAAAVIGVALLFPAGFIFSAEPQRLPPALQSWLFVPHVAVYMMSYVILVLAGAQALLHLCGPSDPRDCERATYRMVRFGFPLLTLGLALGAVWGKMAWGDYWNWDPKELWSLASFLVYVGYLHFRAAFGARYARANSALALAGAGAIILTLLWVNLAGRIFPGLHVYAT